jgi:leucyl/phenylalanyl-tRNA---protein transferase
MYYIDDIAILEEDDDDFPEPAVSPKDRPLAIGRILTPALMLKAYRRGIFAWSSDPVAWWSPDPRAIIEFDGLYISKRLMRKIRQDPFLVTLDRAFEDVIYSCAMPRGEEEGTWISEEFMECFIELFRMGYAHSIECWKEGVLAGGVFGVAIGGFFSAESMFHTVTDASKIAVYYLMRLLKEAGFALFDIQSINPHTQSIGGISISRRSYLQRLKRAVELKTQPLYKEELLHA